MRISIHFSSGVKVKSEPTEFRERATSRTVLKEERPGKDNDGGENDAEKPKQRRACLMLPEDDPAVFTFVAATAKQIGIKMGPQEELAPGVFYPAAQKLLVRVSYFLSYSLFVLLKPVWFIDIFPDFTSPFLVPSPIMCSIIGRRYLTFAGVQNHVRVSHSKEPSRRLSAQRRRSPECGHIAGRCL